MADASGVFARVLVSLGLRAAVPQKKQTLTRKRTGWWGKLSDAADRKAFDWKTREALYAHLAAQVENDVPIEKALDGFAKILGKRNRKSVQALVENVSRRMREGNRLWKAIQIAIPREEVAMIAGGEMTNKLAQALDRIVRSHDRVDSVLRAYRAAAFRPVMYIAMTYALMWTVGAFVMPDIVRGMPESKVQGIGIVMYKAAEWSQSLLAIVPPLLCVGIYFAVRWSLPRWTGARRIAAERHFPYSFYRDIEGFKWLSGFADMIEAGIPDVHAMSRQMEAGSPWLRERLWHIRFRMTEGGMKLPAALEAKSADGKLPPFEFPNPAIVDRLGSIASIDGFHDKVRRLTDRWAVEIERNALTQARKAGGYAEIVMYILMIFLIVAINSVTTQIGGIAGM